MKLALTCLLLTTAAAFAASGNPDQTFFEKAAQGVLAEVQGGQLAGKQASSPAIKEYADMMVQDHGSANEQLRKMAATKNIALPTAPDVSHQAAQQQLASLSGTAFDWQYMQDQVKDHEETVQLLQQQLDSGMDVQAKAFAQDMLPRVQRHLEIARALATLKVGERTQE